MATRERILRVRILQMSAAHFVLMLWLADIRRVVLRGLTRLADIRQAVLGEFGESGECRLDRFMHIKDVICA